MPYLNCSLRTMLSTIVHHPHEGDGVVERVVIFF